MAGESDQKKEKKRDKVDKKEKKSKKHAGAEQGDHAASASTFALLADEKSVDSALSSLFAVKQPPVKPKITSALEKPAANRKSASKDEDDGGDEDNDAELSELEDDDGSESNTDDTMRDGEDDIVPEQGLEEIISGQEAATPPKRKRKRKDAEMELEDEYMNRLQREEDKEASRLAAERVAKRQKKGQEDEDVANVAPAEEEATGDSEDEEDAATPPKHETEIAKDVEVEKANRTIFLGNVSTAAINSKSSRKTLLNHLASFFTELPENKAGSKPKVESIRFRSTPYASAIPKKAAYAKKELMDATTKSTNAYVVYSTPALAREACKRLNGTIILDRHLRVDSIAHPAKVDNKRCVFIGNLGFVDDETNIQEANEEDGREKRKRGKEPADVEEGLWRTMSKCGQVESVRVIRDATTRVGKGIAYVQFEDENAVEAALLLNEKKFPPMLPRKLRVTRAKAPKKNAKPGSGRPSARPTAAAAAATGYRRKVTGAEASQLGRSAKLLGRAAAAKMRQPGDRTSRPAGGARAATALREGIQKPEDFIKKPGFVFEGHRASAKQGKSGLKLGGKKNKSKVTKRSSTFKAKKP